MTGIPGTPPTASSCEMMAALQTRCERIGQERVETWAIRYLRSWPMAAILTVYYITLADGITHAAATRWELP